MTKKLTVTIGIPAHNEAKNIGNLLNSIVEQEQVTYRLNKVIVACDGCTDNTAQIVGRYIRRYPFMQLINDGRWLGKSERINQFYCINTSDIFLALDADVVLGHPQSIEEIATAFTDQQVGLVGGRDVSLPPRSLVEKIIVAGFELWYETRKDLGGGESVHNHHACISAIRRQLCERIYIPKGMIADDDFVYFQTLTLGYKFRWAHEAIVYFRLPDNLREFFNQADRFLRLKHKIADYFGDWVYEHYRVPRRNKIKGLTVMMRRKPTFLLLAVVLQILVRIIGVWFRGRHPDGLWRPIQSSKVLH